MLYTAWSLELACLENLVHITNTGQVQKYKTTEIDIPDSITIKKLTRSALKEGWDDLVYFTISQEIAQKWLDENRYCVLRVPSVIIPGAFNYLLNPAHKDFKKIKVKSIQPFAFDKRLLIGEK